MYEIPHVEYYKLYDASIDENVDYFYSREELVKFISKWYRLSSDTEEEVINSFIRQCVCNKNELFQIDIYGYYKIYILYDNYNRIINVHDFEDSALKLFHLGGKLATWSAFDLYIWRNRIKVSRKYNQWKKTNHKYEYRKDPVPHTRKIRGGPWWSPPHTSQIIKMYANPKYKKFNRGSKKDIPIWWDDRHRRVQKSWKEQSKVRHQWEKNLKRVAKTETLDN